MPSPQNRTNESDDTMPVTKSKENGVDNNSKLSGGKSDSDAVRKVKPVDAIGQSGNAAENSKDGRLSGKEMKAKKQAEKAARREKEKQGKQGQPIVDLGTKNQSERPSQKPPAVASSSEAVAQSGHHKRSGSTGGTTQKMPVRPSQAVAPSLAEEPEKESKNVALFDHLYGPPRRNSIAGAGKDVYPTVLALGLQMRNYTICGSSARCVATLLAFKQVIKAYSTPPHTSLPRHLTTHLSSQIEYIVSCRPMSVSMGNAIRWLKVQISAVDVSTPESRAKSDLCSAIDNFIQEKITLADKVIARKANERIKDGDTILTFAKSNIVQQTLVEAFQQGKKFRVVVVDSRPLFEGKNLASALAELGLNVQYTLIHGLSHVIKDATKLLLGAHAMMSTGRLYSRIGTALVAMTAKEADLPVIVCCESVKFSDRSDLDSFAHNEIAPPEELIVQGKTSSPLCQWEEVPNLQLLNLMYDLTPAEYISMIITEYGPIPPSSVPVIQRLSTGG